MEIPLPNMRKIINSRNAISADQCDVHGGDPKSVNMIEMSPDGFLGVYNGDPYQVWLAPFTRKLLSLA